ncbi:MAG TPA: nuclear transport factor 2 family protein [Caulobacteraceae bacterium]|jgi:hypothetical protein
MKPWEVAFERIVEFGRAPTREKYLAQFGPDATLRHPGMVAPVGLAGIAAFIDASLARWTGYRLAPVFWAASGDTLFVETINSAELSGKNLSWPSTQAINLRGDHIVRGQSFYDRGEVFAQLDPAPVASANAHVSLLNGAAPRGGSADDDREATQAIYESFVLPYAQNWTQPDPQRFKDFYAADARMIGPEFEHPIGRGDLADFYAAHIAAHPGVQRRLETWATAKDVLFLQWTATHDVGGVMLELPVVDRFLLQGGRAVEAVAYYDLMDLAELRKAAQTLEPA